MKLEQAIDEAKKDEIASVKKKDAKKFLKKKQPKEVYGTDSGFTDQGFTGLAGAVDVLSGKKKTGAK